MKKNIENEINQNEIEISVIKPPAIILPVNKIESIKRSIKANFFKLPYLY